MCFLLDLFLDSIPLYRKEMTKVLQEEAEEKDEDKEKGDDDDNNTEDNWYLAYNS